jgi:hypothetical protein
VSTRLEVSGVVARVVPIHGEPLEAVFFLRPTGAQGRTSETLGERLAEPGVRFIPTEIDGGISFLRLSSLAYVEHFGELTELARLAELGAWREPVEISLVSGERLSGDLVYLMPPDRRRVSDLLNDAGRFLLLVDDNYARYVNRDAIEQVRPIGDP